MLKQFFKSLVLLFVPLAPFAEARSPQKSTGVEKNPVVVMETSEGQMKLELFANRAPLTVKNFMDLSQGQSTHASLRADKKGKPFYNGTVFHRIIAGFMIQGGDPEGTGRGGPGYQFQDEVHSDDRFDVAGILAMANAGPNTNGSQFFITLAPTPHLNGRHTIFGKIVQGMDVLKKIGSVATDAADRPLKPVEILKISVQ